MNSCVAKYINVNGRLMDLSSPRVMGILNVTPDSFYADSRMSSDEQIVSRVHQIHREGADIIDIGGYSSRPGADNVSIQEEMARLRKGLQILYRELPEAVVSVDTFRADVAKMCVEELGAGIINDISGGELDSSMFQTVAKLGVPYVLMHMKGTPQNMQQEAHYENLMKEIMLYFAEKVQRLRDLGQKDIILDPGYGFAKTIDHNYELLQHQEMLKIFDLPILVGLSRKSMVYNLLEVTPHQALNGTSVLHTLALLKGANIFRVHDVKACAEVIKIVQKTLHF